MNLTIEVFAFNWLGVTQETEGSVGESLLLFFSVACVCVSFDISFGDVTLQIFRMVQQIWLFFLREVKNFDIYIKVWDWNQTHHISHQKSNKKPLIYKYKEILTNRSISGLYKKCTCCWEQESYNEKVRNFACAL